MARAIDMRFRRQVHILTTPVERERQAEVAPPSPADLDALSERFETLYRRRYGPESTFRAAGIEMVTFRVRATGLVPKPALAPAPLGPPDPREAVRERRPLYVADAAAWIDAVPGYDFDRLRPGHAIDGPAVIWTPITTIVVGSRQTAAVDGYRNVVIWPTEGPPA